MKKSTIWLLVLIMGGAFGCLLYLQYFYVTSVTSMMSTQFDDSVKRVLYQAAKRVEYEELKKALEEDLSKRPNAYIPKQQELIRDREQLLKTTALDGSTILGNISLNTQNIESEVNRNIKTSGKLDLLGKSQEHQDYLRYRFFHQKDVMDDVILETLYLASQKSLSERVDFKKLDGFIKGELLREGLNVTYAFAVVNSNGEVVYKTTAYENEKPINDDHFTQIIFKDDPPSKMGHLEVVFPDRNIYIYKSLGYVVPSLIFTVVLLITFIITISLAFRQKRLTEMKNSFINNMTHEFKTPISTISLASQMLKDPAVAKTPSMFNHISGVIFDETKRLSFQVDKVLQMSLFDRNTSTLKFKYADINKLISGVVGTFTLKVENFGGKINTSLLATNPFATIDEMHFTNVIFNLLDNAVKYKREDEPLLLQVKTWNEQDKLMISIQDNGIGIKKDDLKKIFDRFYRVSTGNLHNVKGFGLGLAYVKKIVTDHKGSIKVESEPKTGTKFIIILQQSNK